MKYRKTALVDAEQFLPAEGKIPDGVRSSGLADPRKSPEEWVLDTLEGQHTLRNGDYICTGPNGEKWNVEGSIFEATYETVASPASSSSVVQGDASGGEGPFAWISQGQIDLHLRNGGTRLVELASERPNARWNYRALFLDALRPQPSGETREAVRQAIVKAIAFLKRDLDTPRINDTVESLLADLVKADAILRGEA